MCKAAFWSQVRYAQPRLICCHSPSLQLKYAGVNYSFGIECHVKSLHTRLLAFIMVFELSIGTFCIMKDRCRHAPFDILLILEALSL